MPQQKEPKELTPEHVRSVELISYLLSLPDVKNKSYLAKTLGLSPSQLGDIHSSNSIKKVLFQKPAKRILKDSFGVNLNWLEYGEGEMINGEGQRIPAHSTKKDNLKGIPVYDISVLAGPGDVFLDELPQPVMTMYIPGFEDCDMIVPVYGESMQPKFISGEYIILKRINHRKVIQYGEPHYIKTHDLTVLKYPKISEDKTKLSLHSENPKFEPFDIEKKSIINMLIVRGKLTKFQM